MAASVAMLQLVALVAPQEAASGQQAVQAQMVAMAWPAMVALVALPTTQARAWPGRPPAAWVGQAASASDPVGLVALVALRRSRPRV
jgi:hypothetical protein